MDETTRARSARVCELQTTIRDLLPEESRHLVGELEEEKAELSNDYLELVIEAIRAYLPHRAEEIAAAWAHVGRGDPDPTLEMCCQPEWTKHSQRC